MPVNDFDRGLIEKFEGHDFEYNPANWERLAKELPAMSPLPVNDFDKALVEKFEGYDFAYSAAGWERLSKDLPVMEPARKRRPIWLPLTGIAAGLALLVSALAIWNRPVSRDVELAARSARKPAAVATVPPIQATAIQPPLTYSPKAATKPDELVATRPAGRPSSAPGLHIAPFTATTGSTSVSAPVPPASFASIPSVIPVAPVQREPQAPVSEPAVTAPAVATQIIPAAALPEAGKETRREPIVQPVAPKLALSSPDPVERQDRFVAIDPDEVRTGRKKASLSLAGGYNQGNTNVGYMVGVNTRKNLNSKFYVEGDVALASSRNAQQTLSMPASTFDAYNTVAPQGLVASAKAASPAETVSDLYYLQVTPVVGYQVFRNWSLGAGADVQRLFQDRDKESFVIQDGEAKSMPMMDMGVVGKTEYTIYRSVKAGLQYRYGMNELLSPGKNYINRSYLQVQLKVGILGSK